MGSARRTDAALGVGAGLVAGLLVATILGAQGRLDWTQPLRVDPATIGWLIHLVVAAAGGALYGALFRYQPGRLAAGLGGGLLLGLMWWAVVWLTMIPFATTGPSWSIAEAAAAFPLLVATVLFGGITAVTFYLAGTRLLSQRQLQRPVAATHVPTSRHIVIVGGGFGGVATAQRLEQLLAHRPDIAVTLVSESNFLLFTPMLAEVASSSLVPRHIAAPLRAVCPRTVVRRASATAVDPDSRSISIRSSPDGPEEVLPYDELVVAVGAVPTFHGLPGVAERAFTLKSLADASELREHVIGLLDTAENESRPDVRRRLLTFVVAGGGFAGVELIAQLHDLVHSVLIYYPRLERTEPRFVLVHSRDRILPELSEQLGEYALGRLRRRGIEFVLGARVGGASPGELALGDGSSIPTETFVWAAGNEPARLVRSLGPERASGLVTDETLRVEGLDHVWAVGDCARIPDADREGQPCPPTAQHALRQGRLAADNIVATIDGRSPQPFRFRTLGMLVVLGHNTAAAEIRGLRFSGLFAWLLWRGIYLAKLPGFEKKVRVLFDWLLDLLFPRDIVVVRSDRWVGAPAEADREPVA